MFNVMQENAQHFVEEVNLIQYFLKMNFLFVNSKLVMIFVDI